MADDLITDVKHAPRGDPTAGTAAWGSDAMAELLRTLEIPYIALTPGASYRGLHDSLVNYLGNTRPEMLLCVHEENAVALAHGYARVTGRPLAVGLHANVGLMHATMAIFNAWCEDCADPAARSRVRRPRCWPPGRSAGRPRADAGARPISDADDGGSAR